MRSRILPAVGIGALALVAATAFAGQASATKAPGAAGHQFGKATKVVYPAKSCYSQGTSLDGFGISSQNFEASFDQYDDQAADDFKVKKSGCTVKTVAVAGFYSASGGVKSANVTFFKNASGVPGAAVKTLNNKKAADDGTGNLTIKLGKKGAKLTKGTYWVSVQANLDFSTGGQWYWAQATDGGGAPAQWQNPGGGFGVCPTWGSVVTCNGATDTVMSFSLS